MFKNRQEASQQLAEKLNHYKAKENVVVLGIPRGGVVTAKRIAQELNCPLDIIVVKKIGAPNEQELAIGAIGETKGSSYLDEKLISELRVSQQYLKEQSEKLKEEIKRRETLYRQTKPPLNLKEKVVIIVDDGTATGATAIAAIREVWNNEPKKVVIALPVAPIDTLHKLEKEADEVVVLETPSDFFAVGQFYENFPQVDDKEVIDLLQKKLQ